MKYLICYDLKTPGRDYKTLWDELERLNAKRILDSQWVTNRTNTSASGLRDHMKGFVDPNDSLFVCTLEGVTDWAGIGLQSAIKDI